MFGSALYYPNVDIEDANWLRTAILFWDEIQTIVPSRIDKPYRTKDTKICEKEGYLRPLRPDLHPNAVKELGERVRKLISRPEWSDRLQIFMASETEMSSSESARNSVMKHLHLAGLYPEKMSAELRDSVISLGFAQLQKGEAEPNIADLVSPHRFYNAHISRQIAKAEGIKNVRYALLEREQKMATEGEWLLVDCDFAELYMAALATMLARDIDVSPLTNVPSAMGTTIESLVCDVASPAPTDARGAIINIVVEGLKINPETPIQDIIAFRRSRTNQLAELAGAFDDLKSKIEKSADSTEVNHRAEQVYRTKVRPALERLKTELRNQSIQSVWEGFSRSATVSVGAGSALAVFLRPSSAASAWGGCISDFR